MNETRAYLYSINDDGTLNVREGLLQPGIHRWSRQGRFTPDGGKWCFVSNDPGSLYHRKMWLPERDDERATQIYIEYHERRIKESERSIVTHQKAIDVLKGAVTL